MRKIVISFTILLMAATAFAKRPTGLTLGAGFGVNSFSLPYETSSYEGFYANVGYDLTLSEHSVLYFGGRFDWMVNGSYSSWHSDYDAGSKDETSKHLFLDIPVKYRFNFNVSRSTKLYLEAGPTATFWLMNQLSQSVTTGGVHTGTTENMFDSGACNRVNVALGGAFGVHFNHVKIYLGYDQYLCSFLKSGNPFVNCSQFRLGAAYVF